MYKGHRVKIKVIGAKSMSVCPFGAFLLLNALTPSALSYELTCWYARTPLAYLDQGQVSRSWRLGKGHTSGGLPWTETHFNMCTVYVV